MKVVGISGYKQHELGIFKQNHPAISIIKLALEKEIRILLDEGLEWVLISGQLGVELWSAEVVLNLQQEFPNLKLAVITPFLHQEERWNEQNKELYEMILSNADFVETITKKPYESPWQFRAKNQFILTKTDLLLLVYDEENQGSPQYLLDLANQYKESKPYEIRLINFYDLQLIADEENSFI